MEELQCPSNRQTQNILYLSSLKVIEITRKLKFQNQITTNELKLLVAQCNSIFCQLQPIFCIKQEQAVYNLIKHITLCYNSIFTLIQIKNSKIQKIDSQPKQNQIIPQFHSINCLVGVGENTRKKFNKFGGVYIYNSDYTRNIEDKRILDQIKQEKLKRINLNKRDLLRQSILQQIQNKAEVQQNNCDQVTNYITNYKKKNNHQNFISCEPQLNEIISFFECCQQQANEYLNKTIKMGKNEQKVSFADLQRQITNRNSRFKQSLMAKLKQFLKNQKQRQSKLEQQLQQLKIVLKEIKQRKIGQFKEIQTDIVWDQFIKEENLKSNQLLFRCNALQNVVKQKIVLEEREHSIKQQTEFKKLQIQKLNNQVKKLEQNLIEMKKKIKEQKNRPIEQIKISTPPKNDNNLDKDSAQDNIEHILRVNVRKEKRKSMLGHQIKFSEANNHFYENSNISRLQDSRININPSLKDLKNLRQIQRQNMQQSQKSTKNHLYNLDSKLESKSVKDTQIIIGEVLTNQSEYVQINQNKEDSISQQQIFYYEQKSNFKGHKKSFSQAKLPQKEKKEIIQILQQVNQEQSKKQIVRNEPQQKHYSRQITKQSEYRISDSHNKSQNLRIQSVYNLYYNANLKSSTDQDHDISNQQRQKNPKLQKQVSKEKVASIIEKLSQFESKLHEEQTNKRVMNWKRRIQHNFKKSLITQKQLDEMLSILKYTKNLPINLNQNLKQSNQIHTHDDSKSIQRQTIEDNIKPQNNQRHLYQKSINLEKLAFKGTAQKQNKNLEKQIKNQKQKIDFCHSKCQSGQVCPHIMKYFETVLKNIQQKSKRLKQSIILPIENIGKVHSLLSQPSQEVSLQQKQKYKRGSLYTPKDNIFNNQIASKKQKLDRWLPLINGRLSLHNYSEK